jgi:hypothetical protein
MDQVEFQTEPKDVTVQRMVFDWNDPSNIVQKEMMNLDEKLFQGCWYLNPMFKVHSPGSICEFLKQVRRCQRNWFRKLNRQFGSANWRRLMRTITEVTERHMTFSGILFINGKEIDPWSQYRLEAELGLHPESDFVVSRRNEANDYLEKQDWNALKEMSRSVLDQQLSANPADPIYVTPGISVMGFLAIPSFYAEVEKRSNEWHRLLTNVLGNRGKADLARQADWITRMLVFNGTLVVDGVIYLPGCWPNHRLSEVKIKNSPFGRPTVPPEYLGLSYISKNAIHDHDKSI